MSSCAPVDVESTFPQKAWLEANTRGTTRKAVCNAILSGGRDSAPGRSCARLLNEGAHEGDGFKGAVGVEQTAEHGAPGRKFTGRLSATQPYACDSARSMRLALRARNATGAVKAGPVKLLCDQLCQKTDCVADVFPR